MVKFPGMNKPQIVVITGPTAVGKTSLAMGLAQRFRAEIVSADTRQIFRHMDIGTAKPTKLEQAKTRHHVIDVVAPDQNFDVARYGKIARQAIADILFRKRRAFVVGGAGLYIRCLTRGLFAGPPANESLREELVRKEETQGAGFLFDWLRRVDDKAARHIHSNDKLRILRALEVWLLTGTPMSVLQDAHSFQEQPYDVLYIRLTRSRDELTKRIAKRCSAMMKKGFVEEVRRLLGMGYSQELPALRTIGYAQITEMLNGNITLEDAIEITVQQTCQLAKRQMTWLRSDRVDQWYEPSLQGKIVDTMGRFFDRS